MTRSKGNTMKKRRRKSILIRLFAVLLAAAVMVMTAVTSVSVMKALYPMKYADLVGEYSERYGVEAELIYAVINTESSFDPDARSDVGALGLMQIMPDTLDWICGMTGETLAFSDLRDPEVSVRCGTFLLKYLLDEFGSDETALAAYHAGRGKVNEWLADGAVSKDGKTLDGIPYRDTAHYVSKVARAADIYRNLYH